MTPLDLTPEQIRRAFPGARLETVRLHWPAIRQALADAGLTSARMVAYALGTIAAETASFRPLKEGVSKYNTRSKPFDLYDGRAALGNTVPGDGARFPGRGFIQLTGRANYARYGARVGVDLLAQPERANEPATAAKLLALFVADQRARIEKALDANDFKSARKAVNGGTHGLDRFVAAYSAIWGLLT